MSAHELRWAKRRSFAFQAQCSCGDWTGKSHLMEADATAEYRRHRAPLVPTPVVGCLVGGHWGQYAPARMIEVAAELGYADREVIDLAERKLAAMMPSTAPDLSDSEDEALVDADDKVVGWLNENVAVEGHMFGWEDGEFFYQPDAWWEDGS